MKRERMIVNEDVQSVLVHCHFGTYNRGGFKVISENIHRDPFCDHQLFKNYFITFKKKSG